MGWHIRKPTGSLARGAARPAPPAWSQIIAAASWTRSVNPSRLGSATAICLVALTTLTSAAGAQQWAPANGQVTRAIDGESIEVKLADRLEIVRYAGVSTPELHHPTRGIDFYRRAAMAENAKMVVDKRVLLTFDVEPRDRHGRLLAYVWAGNCS